MSVAIMPGVRSSQSASIGRLVEGVLRAQEDHEYQIPCLLRSREDRLRYSVHIKRRMKDQSVYRTIDARTKAGRLVRTRVLKLLDQLCHRGSGAFPATRTQWLRLRQLALFCARDQDWASETGPVIGAVTSTLARYLGVNDINEALAPLLRCGLLALWSPNANGRRSFHISGSDTDAERIMGSGWTLAPLLLHIDVLEEIVAKEQARLELRQNLVLQARQDLRLARSILSERMINPDLFDKISALSEKLHNAKKGQLARLQNCRQDIADLLIMIEDLCPSFREEDPLPPARDSCPAIYSDNQSKESSTCHQGALSALASSRSDLRGSKPRERQNAPYGLPGANFGLNETIDLFPDIHSLLPDLVHRENEALDRLARVCGVSLPLARRAERVLGTMPAIVCIMIIAYKMERSLILTSPDRYMSGMVKRGAAGTLNLTTTLEYIKKTALSNSSTSGSANDRSSH